MGVDRRFKRRSLFEHENNALITNFYIDGFNLYHRALQNLPGATTPTLKWLNLARLAEELCPTDHIQRIHYFSAKVNARPSDPSQPQRQQVYWRALRTLPNLRIHEGVFRNRYKSGILVKPRQSKLTIGTIKAPEEKRSDVNLATQLMIDAFSGNSEKVAVITDDSDFAMPLRYIRESLGVEVVVFNPATRKRSNAELRHAASNIFAITRRHLVDSQFPRVVIDAQKRSITKPKSW